MVGEAEGLPSGLLGGDNQARVTWVRGAAGSPCGFVTRLPGDLRVSSFRLTPGIGLRAEDVRRIGPSTW